MTKNRTKRILSEQMLIALRSGLSVEDLLDSVAMAVAAKLSLSTREPDPRYRRELNLFYRSTIRHLRAARGSIEAAGVAAKKLA